MTLLVGFIVTLGALFVGGFGGAFEANKLLAGVFAVPMIVPVIFGILMRKPQPWGALATLFLGTILGFILNMNKAISWEAATLIEIAFCTVMFMVSGLFPSKDVLYNNRVSAFFHKLSVPFVPDADNADQDVFKDAIKLMYGIAFGLTGLMFVIMGFPSRSLLSGQLALVAGVLCLGLSLFLWRQARKVTAIIKEEPSETTLH